MSRLGVAAATAIRVQAANPAQQIPVQVFRCGSSRCAGRPRFGLRPDDNSGRAGDGSCDSAGKVVE